MALGLFFSSKKRTWFSFPVLHFGEVKTEILLTYIMRSLSYIIHAIDNDDTHQRSVFLLLIFTPTAEKKTKETFLRWESVEENLS